MVLRVTLPHVARADSFLEHLRLWVHGREDIRAVVVVGSFARGQARPDSDLDVLILCQNQRRYIDEHNWISDLGLVHSVQVEEYGRVTALRARFDDGLEVELGIAPSDWASVPYDSGTMHVAKDGIAVLFDRDGEATTLAAL